MRGRWRCDTTQSAATSKDGRVGEQMRRLSDVTRASVLQAPLRLEALAQLAQRFGCWPPGARGASDTAGRFGRRQAERRNVGSEGGSLSTGTPAAVRHGTRQRQRRPNS